MPPGAAVAQGVRAVLVVAMHPGEDGFVLPADVGAAGGGVVGPRGDEIQGLEAFAGAGMGGVERGLAQLLQRLLPLAHLDACRGTAPLAPTAGDHMPPNLPRTAG